VAEGCSRASAQNFWATTVRPRLNLLQPREGLAREGERPRESLWREALAIGSASLLEERPSEGLLRYASGR